MSYQNLNAIPAQLVIGDSVAWEETHGDYPSATWTLSYRFVKDGDQQEIDGSDKGDGVTHLLEIDGTASALFEVAVYHWQAQVDDGSDRHTVARGRIEMFANFEGETDGYDNRGHVEATLQNLEAVILGKASADQLSYAIAGRTLSRYSPEELIRWRTFYKAEYRAILAAEAVEQGKATGRQILSRLI